MIRVAVVDDHQMVRKSFGLLVDSFPEFRTIYLAENGQELILKLRTEIPDVVLLDIQMPVMDGLATCKFLHENYPDVKVLILSELNDAESVRQVFEVGANGYLTKNSDPAELGAAIRKVYQNDFYFTHSLGNVLKQTFFSDAKKATTEPAAILSDREIEVIRLAASEMSNAEIADRLCISVRTAETHRKRIMDKINAKNFLGVVLYALRNKIIHLEEL